MSNIPIQSDQPVDRWWAATWPAAAISRRNETEPGHDEPEAHQGQAGSHPGQERPFGGETLSWVLRLLLGICRMFVFVERLLHHFSTRRMISG